MGEDPYESFETKKFDLNREFNDSETSQYLIAAGRQTWVATCKSATSAFLSSLVLQGKKKTISLLKTCRDVDSDVDCLLESHAVARVEM